MERTLEEVDALFGDEHIVSRWYGLSEAEKEKLAHAMAEFPEDCEDASIGVEKVEATKTENARGGRFQVVRIGSA
jgi:hypothetical protein